MKFYLFLPLFIIAHGTFCQNVVKAFFDKNGRAADEGNCYYYEVRKTALSNEDTIRTYYFETNQLRSIEPVNETGFRTGMVQQFHPNGAIQLVGSFEDGKPNGVLKTWYLNGSPRSVEDHENSKDYIDGFLINYWDSTGNLLITNGSGFCRCIFNSYRHGDKLEKGRLIEGKRDSLWLGYRSTGEKYYEEWYKRGEFISGKSYDLDGLEYHYTLLSNLASPHGGLNAFYKFVATNITYPKAARRARVQGKVLVQFTIEKDGSLSDFTVLKAIGGGCDEEAVRIISSSPKWIPAQRRGQHVRQKIALPIQFKLP